MLSREGNWKLREQPPSTWWANQKARFPQPRFSLGHLRSEAKDTVVSLRRSLMKISLNILDR